LGNKSTLRHQFCEPTLKCPAWQGGRQLSRDFFQRRRRRKSGDRHEDSIQLRCGNLLRHGGMWRKKWRKMGYCATKKCDVAQYDPILQ
jgi:hypothetical protein